MADEDGWWEPKGIKEALAAMKRGATKIRYGTTLMRARGVPLGAWFMHPRDSHTQRLRLALGSAEAAALVKALTNTTLIAHL